MKRIWLIFTILLYLSLFSCKEEQGPSCPPDTGELFAFVNDTIQWDFKYVYFIRWSETEFASQWADSSLQISADFINAGCEIEVSLELRNIGQILENQPLVQPVNEENHPSLMQPNSIFNTWNVDVLTERFELLEIEPAWVQLTSITDEEIEGSFQATYVYRPSAFRFWELPDTLRFHETPFLATRFSPSSE